MALDFRVTTTCAYMTRPKLLEISMQRESIFTEFPSPPYDATELLLMARRRIVTDPALSGHTLGSHTWSHADLTTLDEAGINQGMDLT